LKANWYNAQIPAAEEPGLAVLQVAHGDLAGLFGSLQQRLAEAGKGLEAPVDAGGAEVVGAAGRLAADHRVDGVAVGVDEFPRKREMPTAVIPANAGMTVDKKQETQLPAPNSKEQDSFVQSTQYSV